MPTFTLGRMLSDEQQGQFARDGCLRLPGAFDRSTVDAMGKRIWSFLAEKRGVRRDDPATWAIDAPWFGLKALRQEVLFQSLISSKLDATIDALLGAGTWRRPRDWGGLLVTFPGCTPAEWNLPAGGWHVDFHFTHEPGTPFGVRVFTFLSDVPPRGGGTLVVRASHRLVETFVGAMTAEERAQSYATLRQRFYRTDPWLYELTCETAPSAQRVARFMEEPHEIDGIPVRVDELCGAPGDAFLIHPWILHVTAPNAGPGPRFMLAKCLYNEDLRQPAGARG